MLSSLLSTKCWVGLALLFVSMSSCAQATSAPIKSSIKSGDGLIAEIATSKATNPIGTVIYVTGLGGKGNSIQKLANVFLDNDLNLVTFDRDEPACQGFQCFGTVGSRVPSGQPIYAEGQPSALDHIVANELSSVINFVTQADWYQSAPKLYLVGGSYGAWITLQASATPELTELISGAVFVSPSIAPHKSTGKYASEALRFDAIKHGLISKPVLAIGSDKDILFPGATTADSVTFLEAELTGTKFFAVKESTGKHAKELLFYSKIHVKKIIDWILEQAK